MSRNLQREIDARRAGKPLTLTGLLDQTSPFLFGLAIGIMARAPIIQGSGLERAVYFGILPPAVDAIDSAFPCRERPARASPVRDAVGYLKFYAGAAAAYAPEIYAALHPYLT